MKKLSGIQFTLLLTALAAFGLIGVAFFLQTVERMMPCPLCVIQRYAFIVIGIGALIGMNTKPILRKIGCSIGLYGGITGAGVAIHHLYVIAHPDIKCGIDPIQTAVNNLPFADWFPSIFLAEGLCGTPYDPIMGLSVPQWSLVWMVIFTITLLIALFKPSFFKGN